MAGHQPAQLSLLMRQNAGGRIAIHTLTPLLLMKNMPSYHQAPAPGVRPGPNGTVPTYLSPQEAADFLGISISTLYRWRVQRGLRTLRPFSGARPHFLHADLQSFMARMVEGSPEQSGVLADDVAVPGKRIGR